MADYHSCENCIYSDAFNVDDKGKYICRYKEKNPKDLINTSMPTIGEVNYCNFFFDKAIALEQNELMKAELEQLRENNKTIANNDLQIVEEYEKLAQKIENAKTELKNLSIYGKTLNKCIEIIEKHLGDLTDGK